MSNNKQSSVEWLINQLQKSKDWHRVLNEISQMSSAKIDIIEQAKAMHKEEKKQVLKDYFAWHKSKGFVSHKKEDIEEFINETFGGNHE